MNPTNISALQTCSSGHTVTLDDKFCRECGESAKRFGVSFSTSPALPVALDPEAQRIADAILFEDVPPANASSKLPEGICPKCLCNDQVQNIGVIIDEGTSRTVGKANTNGITSTQGGTLGSGFVSVSKYSSVTTAETSLSSVTTTGLASRFTTRERPKPVTSNGTIFLFLLALVFLFSMPIAGVVTLLIAAISIPITKSMKEDRRKEIAAWNRGLAQLRNGYFCKRDGIAFDSENTAEPALFVATSFKLAA